MDINLKTQLGRSETYYIVINDVANLKPRIYRLQLQC